MELTEVNFVRTGPRGKPPIVLLHSVGLDLTYWDAQIDAFGAFHDVIAYDLPGHGRSPGTASDCTLAAEVEILIKIIRLVGSQPAHIVGLSVGGMIGQALAISAPELVASLVLIDTAPTFSQEAREGMRKRAVTAREGGMRAVIESTLERWFTEATRACRPQLIDRVVKTLLAGDPMVHAAMWDMIREIEFLDQLKRIVCPTMIIVGEVDPSSPPSAAKLMASHIAGSTVHVIPQTSHLAVLENPNAITDLMRAFLRKLS